MAAKSRRQAFALKEALLSKSRGFSFLQAMRLLSLFEQLETPQKQEASEPETVSDSRRSIRVRPELSLAFPGTDMAAIEAFSAEERAENKRDAGYLITASFLGLYGASSPLPTYYTEDLLEEAAEDMSTARDLIDIINAPFYHLLYAGWRKYRLDIKVIEERDPRILGRLFSLLGLENETIRRGVDNAYSLIRYIGLFSQHPRSAKGLEALIADAMAESRLSVVPCISRRVAIPQDQLCRLGISGNHLGVDCYAGREVKDRMGKFRMRVGPLNWDEFHTWLPGTTGFEKLSGLIRVYLDQPLEWDLELVLIPGAVGTAGLGDDRGARLGWNTWVFSDEAAAGDATAGERRLTALIRRP